MTPLLPRVMVAPNGARRSKVDHPRLPVSISETVEAAKACFEVGAGGLHAHIRDSNGRHSLDARKYAELLACMKSEAPRMIVQITTESAGIYSPADQRDLLEKLCPPFASVAIREMLSDGDWVSASKVYQTAAETGTSIQHILYDESDLALLTESIKNGTVPSDLVQVLLVLGAYDVQKQANPDDFQPRLMQARQRLPDAHLTVCAFGIHETPILRAALKLGINVRVGFENNLHSVDGSLARDNAARVREILAP